MSNPLIAPRAPKPAEPAVVDIRRGWKFGFKGLVVKKALMEKVARIEMQIADLLSQLEREMGTDSKAIVGLFVAVQSDDPNVKARYVRDLAQRVVHLQAERDRLARASKGFASDMIYIVSEADMKEMGL